MEGYPLVLSWSCPGDMGTSSGQDSSYPIKKRLSAGSQHVKIFLRPSTQVKGSQTYFQNKRVTKLLCHQCMFIPAKYKNGQATQSSAEI